MFKSTFSSKRQIDVVFKSVIKIQDGHSDGEFKRLCVEALGV